MNVPEQRVLHQMPHEIADTYFELFKECACCAYPEPRTPRQNARINVYNWRKGIHLPDHDGIDPVANGWPLADLSAPSTAQMGSSSSSSEDDSPGRADFGALSGVEASRQPQPNPRGPPTPPPAAEYAALLERIDWNDWNHEGPSYPPSPGPPPPRPRVVVRQSRRLAQDLRTLADFLFECKDLPPVTEGAYLAASDALRRVWEQCPL
jgi:hypothetical protein